MSIIIPVYYKIEIEAGIYEFLVKHHVFGLTIFRDFSSLWRTKFVWKVFVVRKYTNNIDVSAS